jgi:hypothetical protein
VWAALAGAVASPASPQAITPVVEWAWTSSAVQPTALNVMMTPSVVDLDGDGTPEIVFGSTASTGGGSVEAGYLRAVRGDTGAEVFTVTDTAYQINTTSSVAVGDIDGDGRPEIIACDTSGARLIAFEHDGTFKWRSASLEAVYWGAPAIADLNQDGTPEIVVGRQVLSAAGAILWTGTGGRGNLGQGPLSLVADVDDDGAPEVVAGNTVYSATGTIERTSLLPDGSNAVANFDVDGQAEIVLVAGGRVWLLEDTLAVKWGPVVIPGGGTGGPPTIADFDGDGAPEIGVAAATRYAVFETDGTLKWAAVTQDSSSNVTGSSVFDFDGDGAAEVVYSDELRLWVYRGTDGAVLYQTPLSSCTWHEYPLVADVDADSHAEIVAVANNNCGFGSQRGVYVFGDPEDAWVPTRRIWNQHTYHITNVAADGSIPVVELNNWDQPGLNNFRLNEFGRFGPWVWRIDKTADQSALVLAPGESATVTYRVRVSAVDGLDVDECADVGDSLQGPLGRLCAATSPFEHEFAYARQVGPYAACGEYRVANTATLVTADTGTTLRDTWLVTVQVPCTPELLVTALADPPAVVVLKEAVRFTDTTKNRGVGTPLATRTRYYLSLDQTKGTGDKRLGGGRLVPALAAGASSTATKRVVVPASARLGLYYLLACADDTLLVGEGTYEDNNCRASVTRVEVRAPDLIVEALSAPPPAAARGGSFAVTTTERNQGNADAAVDSTTRFYLSLDAKKGASDVLLGGTRTVPPLAVGAAVSGTTTVTVPAATAPAGYFLLACADDLKKVAEANTTLTGEKNNCRASATTVAVGP